MSLLILIKKKPYWIYINVYKCMCKTKRSKNIISVTLDFIVKYKFEILKCIILIAYFFFSINNKKNST